MPKINEYINTKPVEIVHEIKNEKDYQVPSFEEFMETYQTDEKVNYADLESGSVGGVESYGPGSSQSSYSDNSNEARMVRHGVKTLVGGVSNITTKAVGPVPSLIVGGAAKVVGEVGHALSSSDEAKDAWRFTSDLGEGMAVGTVVGEMVGSSIAPVFESSSSSLVREGWSLWQEFQDKGGWDRSMAEFHKFHRAAGKDYCSCCDVCKS